MSTPEQDLAQWFAAMARNLQSRSGVEATLDATCQLAVDAIEGCQSAGVSLVHRSGRIDTPAASTELVHRIHSMQNDVGEGPALDVIWEQHTVQIDDMSAIADRWPRFASRASELGVGSMLCFQLFTDRDTLGALNLFSDRPHAFDADDLERGLIFASHGAVALAGAQSEDNWAGAVHSRQLIGEAVGILSERHAITTSAAFAMLSKASQEHNIKLRELAYRLVTTEDQHREGQRSTGDDRAS